MIKRVGVLVIVLLGSLACAQGAEATVRTKCAAKWPGDAQMRAYCERVGAPGVRVRTGMAERLQHAGVLRSARSRLRPERMRAR